MSGAKRQQNLGALLNRGAAASEEPLVTKAETAAAKEPAPVTKKAAAEPATPPTDNQGPGDVTVIRAATLVPADLYEQIKEHHSKEGTFGQLITWACLDFPNEITEEVLAGLRARGVSRTPRVAGRGGVASTGPQIAPRFMPEENEVVLALLERIKTAAVKAAGDSAGPRVTRTALHVAALSTWAHQHPHTPDVD